MQEIQFLQFTGGSNSTHAHSNYFIFMRFFLINMVGWLYLPLRVKASYLKKIRCLGITSVATLGPKIPIFYCKRASIAVPHTKCKIASQGSCISLYFLLLPQEKNDWFMRQTVAQHAQQLSMEGICWHGSAAKILPPQSWYLASRILDDTWRQFQ